MECFTQKKGSNVKAVPAFKPSTGPSDSIAEKSNSGAAGSGWSLENPVASIKDKKKKNGRKSQVSPKVNKDKKHAHIILINSIFRF